MHVPIWVSILLMAIGVLAVLRAALIVAGRGNGRFRFDPWLSLAAGFTLILLGQYLLSTSS